MITPEAHARSSLPTNRKGWNETRWYTWVTNVTAKEFVKARLDLVDLFGSNLWDIESTLSYLGSKYQGEVKRRLNLWWKQR